MLGSWNDSAYYRDAGLAQARKASNGWRARDMTRAYQPNRPLSWSYFRDVLEALYVSAAVLPMGELRRMRGMALGLRCLFGASPGPYAVTFRALSWHRRCERNP
jgi:hypothetical protein